MGEKGNLADAAQVTTAVASSPGIADTVVSVVSSTAENVASSAGNLAQGVALGIAEERVREKLAERRDAKDEDQADHGDTAPPSQPPTA